MRAAPAFRKNGAIATSFQGILAAVVLALAAGCRSSGPAPSADHPSLVVISIDTLGAGMLRAFDASAGPLPHLDAFADRSARLAAAHSTASWTLPAHASLLTGLYPPRHGATDPRRRLADGLPSLARRLHAAGFETVAFTDGGYLHRKYGFAAGFERYDGWRAGSLWSHLRTRDPLAGVLPRDGKWNSPFREGLFDRAIALLSRRPPDARPLFLFLHTYALHDYFKTDHETGEPAGANRPFDRYYHRCLKGLESCSADDWRRMRERYAAELRSIDAAFGRLLGALERARLGERTFVVVLSDHGEGFDVERGRIHHGGRLHVDQIRVPLLVAGPGIPPGEIDRPVSLVDVFPTILDLFDLPAEPGLDGSSFAADFGGGAAVPPPPAVYASEHFYRWEDGRRLEVETPSAEALAVAVVRGAEWYIRSSGSEELYEMTTDPGQTRDRINGRDAEPRFRDLADRHSQASGPAVAIERDDEVEEGLRSLGYVQ